jgi:protein-S-isoprenylcysteine O-methyltransferase Ste14
MNAALAHAPGAVLLAAGLLCFAAFCWGVKSHFRRTGRIPPGTQAIAALSAAGFGCFLLRLALCRLGPAWPAALALFVLSAGLFAWTVGATRQSPPTLAFDTDQPAVLLRHGPYRLVRHPFYLSYVLFWAGTAAASPGPWPWLTPAVMTAVYLRAALLEERKFGRSGLASAYEMYRGQAGLFWPRLYFSTFGG